jgi:hypothetical protein
LKDEDHPAAARGIIGSQFALAEKSQRMYSYEAPAIDEAPVFGECYCHLSMHSEAHSPRPCHLCEEEMRREWPEAFDAEPEEPEPFEIGVEEWRVVRRWNENEERTAA